MGDSLPAGVHSLRATFFENQTWHAGIAGSATKEKIQAEFSALFSPHELDWREKALQDARQAFEGILAAEGFFK